MRQLCRSQGPGRKGADAAEEAVAGVVGRRQVGAYEAVGLAGVGGVERDADAFLSGCRLVGQQQGRGRGSEIEGGEVEGGQRTAGAVGVDQGQAGLCCHHGGDQAVHGADFGWQYGTGRGIQQFGVTAEGIQGGFGEVPGLAGGVGGADAGDHRPRCVCRQVGQTGQRDSEAVAAQIVEQGLGAAQRAAAAAAQQAGAEYELFQFGGCQGTLRHGVESPRIF